jgi:metal-responsive CopG/Arc/MetJ family transcriptional regulator
MLTKEKVTLTLPSDLMETVRSLVPPRRQSQFIAEAIRYFVAEQQRRSLRERLIAGYHANAAADVDLAAEWSAAEDEAWLDHVPPYVAEERSDDTDNPAR